MLRPDIDDDVSKVSDSKMDDQVDDKLPILPPIILLDFGNGTDDENVTSEEKSKRTVNNGLGYGLDKNAVQMRKYNYYFPAGKTGTTVSIEESISPFLPKTIIERVLPANSKRQFDIRENPFAMSFSDINLQSQTQTDLRYSNVAQSTKPQSVFGLRTKPQKAAASSESYQNFFTTSRTPVSSFVIQNSGYRNNDVSTTMQSPLAASVTETVTYVTPSPENFANSQRSSLNYVTAEPFQYNRNSQTYTGQRQNIQSNINSHGFGSVSHSVESSTLSPLNYNSNFPTAGSSFSNGPKYTLEDGIRYEKKVFWKYPDGRVSDMPPRTFETYSEYPQSLTQQPTKSQAAHSIYESSSTENSILSQGPVQFPIVPDPTGREPNPFVSAESLSSSLPQQQVYRLGYQNLVTQRQNVNLAQQRKPSGNVAPPYSFSSSLSSGKTRPSPSGSKINSRYQRPPSRYMTNSANPEYTSTYSPESVLNVTTSGDAIFGSSTEPKKHGFNNNDLNSYSDLRYSDLLSYNPSISEYIRNPSSILNVRPTFVQAGNSLIPVIILRVDGASPIQTKATQNINLKALLQQYLVQYAKSIQELAQPSTYVLGTESFSKRPAFEPNKSPVLDLIRLTQDDARETPSYDSNSYIGKSSYEASGLDNSKDFVSGQYAERPSGRQKTKSVQIIEDPRFPAYKAKN
ncbi:PREDICTED: uncharacterized protein LOC108548424 [Eufriesea mexicana]|uniref:uncharacterized protein LOC108548424 n=1 Tax=Eufriesea mexicana TaxID=516756 RepID=UPI00083BE013|nr:PREDICTED: uncharacterized protein LOC108548424 [Eufriesea mexicana]